MSRKVRVAAFTDKSEKRPRTVDDNLDWTCGVLDRMAPEKPDIVCLTETFDMIETGKSYTAMAQDLSGGTFSRIAQKAKEMSCYIVCGFVEKRDGVNHNCAAVIDRRGELAGRYYKIHPTNWEIVDNVIPGCTDPSVIKTDFGTIGCQICFDANWIQGWKHLKDNGAEIIFFPSAFSAGRILQSISTILHVPIVAACCQQCCRIIDRDGLIVNRQGVYQDWVLATLDLDNPLFHLDFQFDKVGAVRNAHGKDVMINIYEEEGWWRILPQRDDLDIRQIIKEFELETLEDYLARSERVQRTRRNAAMLAEAGYRSEQ